MIHFVGAGCGAEDLITVRGARLLAQADVIIYAGSLVNPALLAHAREDCEVHDSASMTLGEVIACMCQAEHEGKMTVRLHTGDPSLYGAIREQMDALDERGIAYDCTPGVSAFGGAAAALGVEYTLPGVSQTLIITRVEGRTSVPEGERLRDLARHGCSIALYLSTGLVERVQAELLQGAYGTDTPAAIVYKASWPDERVARCTVGTLARTAREAEVTRMALIVVGGFLGDAYGHSRLYDPSFSHLYRSAVPTDGTEGGER